MQIMLCLRKLIKSASSKLGLPEKPNKEFN